MNPRIRRTLETRREALRLAAESGLSARDIAQLFEVDERQVTAWLRQKERKQ